MKSIINKRPYFLITYMLILLISINVYASNNPGSEVFSDNEFRLHISQGRIHYLRREYRKAIKKWNPLIQNKAFSDNLRNWLNKAYDKVLSAYEYYKKAYNHYENEDLKLAEISCIEALQIYPNYKEAIALLEKIKNSISVQTNIVIAKEFLEQKEYDQAIKACNEALKLDPDNANSKKLIEESLIRKNNLQLETEVKRLIKEGITLYSNKKYTAAKNTFNNTMKLDSENFTAIKYLDELKQIQTDIEEKNLLKDEADNYYQAGINLYNNGEYDKSLKEFQNASSLIPDYNDTKDYFKKIEKQLEKKELAKKKKDERLILEYLNQGITYYYNGENKMSIAELEECLKLDPENEYAIKYIQKAKEALSQKEDEYISDDSPYYALFLKLKRKGSYYYDIADYTESLKWWEKILKLFPSNREARELAIIIALKLDKSKTKEFLAQHYNDGKKYLKNNEYKNALKEFEMIQKIDPDYSDINIYIDRTRKYLEKPPVVTLPAAILKQHYDIGLKYYKEKNYDKAIQEWKKILIDNSPDNPYRINAILNINKVQRKISFSIESVKKAKPVSTKSNKMAKQHYLKGVAFYVKGKYKSAIKEWQIVLKYEPKHRQARNNIKKCKRKMQFSQ